MTSESYRTQCYWSLNSINCCFIVAGFLIMQQLYVCVSLNFLISSYRKAKHYSDHLCNLIVWCFVLNLFVVAAEISSEKGSEVRKQQVERRGRTHREKERCWSSLRETDVFIPTHFPWSLSEISRERDMTLQITLHSIIHTVHLSLPFSLSPPVLLWHFSLFIYLFIWCVRSE